MEFTASYRTLRYSYLYKFGLVLILACSYFTQINSISCNPDSEVRLRAKFYGSELVVRCKIIELRNPQAFVVKIINVYKGENATEGQNVNITNIPSSSELSTVSSAVCMNGAMVRGKYILYLKRQSPNDSRLYLIYEADLASKFISRTVRQLAEHLATESNEFVTTMAMETQSDADHYAPCSPLAQAHYCKNGGKCLHIIQLNADSCQCPGQYWGSRCQMFMYQTGEDYGADSTPFIVLGCMFAFIFLLCLIVVVLYIKNRKRRVYDQTKFSGDEESTNIEKQHLPIDNNQNTKVQHEKECKITTKSNIPSKKANEDKTEANESSPLNTSCYKSSVSTSRGSLVSKESSV